jgi:tRNA G18 (ribose-2'-O)-methylase SpoU
MLRAEGFAIIAVEQTTTSVGLSDFDWPAPPWVIVLGHEVRGLSEEVLTACTHAVEIPQYGTKHSLNVAVAGGIVLYQAVQALLHQGLRIC